MALNKKPVDGVTTYPYEYGDHKQVIEKVDFVVENGGKVVTCHVKLQNGLIVTGVHEQHHDVDVDKFKHKAYHQAIERIEQHGFTLDNPAVAEKKVSP